MRYPTAVLALLVASCGHPTDPAATPDTPDEVASINARPPDTHSRANLVWADEVVVGGVSVPAGIRGDGRLKSGVPATGSPSNEYQGDWCGVAATLLMLSGEPGDLNYTPGGTSVPACGGLRTYSFYFGGPGAPPQIFSSHSIARGLTLLAPGASQTQWEGFGTPVAGCSKLMFDDIYPPASSPRQARLSDSVRTDGVIVRRWKVESQGSHQGVCLTYNKNGSVKTVGPWHFMPFSLMVVEVPYPYSTFP